MHGQQNVELSMILSNVNYLFISQNGMTAQKISVL